MRNALTFIIMCLSWNQAWALSFQGGPLGLGASPMGMAGAVVAMPTAGDSLFWNPAGMGDLDAFGTVASVGTGGDFGPTRSGLGLVLPIPGYGSFGAAYGNGRYNGNSAFSDSEALVAAAFEVGQGFWVGSTQKYLSADPGGLRGWSMDIGMQSQFGSSFRLGLNLSDAASSLAWANGLEESQPLTLAYGLAWRPFADTWIALQSDWMDGAGNGAVGQWRAGLNSSWASQRFILRLGATQVNGAADLFATGGVGSHFVFGGTRVGLDYAVLTPASSASVLTGLRHLLSLSMDFGVRARQESNVGFSKLLKDPSNHIQRARINLSAEDSADVSAWELQIRNAKGAVVRSFKGKGVLPASVAWDGKGDQGSLVEDDGLSYSLRTTSRSGRQKEKRAALAAVGLAASALAGVEDSAGSDFGLRPEDIATRRKPSRVKPSLRGSGQFKLKGAEFDLSDVAQAPVNNWELRIVDEAGNTVKKFSGKGRPPKNLSWQGKNDLGDTVDGALGASYVLRVEDESGKATESRDDLVRDEDFSSLVRDKPLPLRARTRNEERVSSAGEGSTVCERDFDSGGWICSIQFQDGETEVRGETLTQVREAAQVARRSELPVFEARGYADRHEGNAAERVSISQERADNVLRVLMEGYESKPDSLTSKGYGDAKPLSKSEPAQNRRVIILIHD